MSAPYGLGWTSDFLSIEPVWTSEPELQAVRHTVLEHLNLGDTAQCDVSFLVKGTRNRVYAVQTKDGEYIMRVALPLDPESVITEISTMRFVCAKTSIPVPEVIAFGSTGDNKLRFPWILMKKIRGEPLQASWRTMQREEKRKIVTQLALFQTQLDSVGFDRIGSVQVASAQQDEFDTARLLKHDYRRLPKVSTILPNEPYRKPEDWIRDRLQQYLAKIDALNPDEFEPTDRKFFQVEATRRRAIATAILDFLPRLWPHEANPGQDRYTLLHSDLHPGNILIDDQNNISGIIDWEFLQTVPSWLAKGIPKLLLSLKRNREPDREAYGEAEDYLDDDERLACQGVSAVYWEARDQYECTLLRAHYIAQMDMLSPGWQADYEATKFERMIHDEVSNLEYNALVGKVVDRMGQFMPEEPGRGMSKPFAVEDTACFDEWFDYLDEPSNSDALVVAEQEIDEVPEGTVVKKGEQPEFGHDTVPRAGIS